MTHPRTAMLDLLESLRITVNSERGALSDTQVLLVLAEVMRDHLGVAFDAAARPSDSLNK